MEKTLVLLKPDCYQKKLTGEVIRRFEGLGLTLCGCKMLRFSEALLAEHYEHHVTKPFFRELADFMKSGPVVALVLAGENVVDRVRDFVGPTDPAKAAKGTIRGDLADDKMRNIIHASDSTASATAEIKRFFREDELFGG
jgi:nucleoside-diphosphate kinase